MLRGAKPEPEKDKDGIPVLTKKFLKEISGFESQFETPRLCKQLYLHQLGISQITCMEDYSNLRVLRLEYNCISRVSGLESLHQLRCLYLQYNYIQTIENLDLLVELVTLNLSHNNIRFIENLEKNVKLQDLDISYNRLSEPVSLQNLSLLPALFTLDLSYDSIEDPSILLQDLPQLEKLACLYLNKNPCTEEIPFFRKQIISLAPNLNYYNDRPISELDRVAAQAWAAGGIHAEEKTRKLYLKEKTEKSRKEAQVYCQKYREKQLTMKEKDSSEYRQKMADDREKRLNSQIQSTVSYLESLHRKFTDISLKEKRYLTIEKLENLLVKNSFDFLAVYNEIKEEYDDTPESLRDFWTENEITMQDTKISNK